MSKGLNLNDSLTFQKSHNSMAKLTNACESDENNESRRTLFIAKY